MSGFLAPQGMKFDREQGRPPGGVKWLTVTKYKLAECFVVVDASAIFFKQGMDKAYEQEFFWHRWYKGPGQQLSHDH
jgi:hypothetical protein